MSTLQISDETKSILESQKRQGESYETVIKRLISLSTRASDEYNVVLTMTKENYTILSNRQDWPICRDILVTSRQGYVMSVKVDKDIISIHTPMKDVTS